MSNVLNSDWIRAGERVSHNHSKFSKLEVPRTDMGCIDAWTLLNTALWDFKILERIGQKLPEERKNITYERSNLKTSSKLFTIIIIIECSYAYMETHSCGGQRTTLRVCSHALPLCGLRDWPQVACLHHSEQLSSKTGQSRNRFVKPRGKMTLSGLQGHRKLTAHMVLGSYWDIQNTSEWKRKEERLRKGNPSPSKHGQRKSPQSRECTANKLQFKMGCERLKMEPRGTCYGSENPEWA